VLQEIGPPPAEWVKSTNICRGFKVEVKSRAVGVVPNVTVREPGLFYTPKAIVSYIVQQTLGARLWNHLTIWT
jgi:hypothetical protein